METKTKENNRTDLVILDDLSEYLSELMASGLRDAFRQFTFTTGPSTHCPGRYFVMASGVSKFDSTNYTRMVHFCWGVAHGVGRKEETA